jgi:hypothetical protein
MGDRPRETQGGSDGTQTVLPFDAQVSINVFFFLQNLTFG